MNIKIGKCSYGVLFASIVLSSMLSCSNKAEDENSNNPSDIVKTDVVFWLTNSDQSVLFQKQNISLLFETKTNQFPTINIDTTQVYQTIDGFGFCLTGGSANVINHLPLAERDALIEELFSTDSTFIGISYIRVSIGASDLSSSVFSYDDMYNGQTDLALNNFSLEKDKTDLIPVLKQALLHNPDLKILGSPWSPPAWMKTNNSSVGGSLKPEYYDVYARYLVKYIQSMEDEGIHIDAITPQNEPLNPNNNPSLSMSSAEQANFIKNNLGPAFLSANLTTKIIVYDHNCDHPEYPIYILNDANASQYIDGSAFHLYAGDISALSQVHDAFPSKSVYFTEQWVGGGSDFKGNLQWHVKNLIIGAISNWSKNVIEWNLASDPNYQPHTNGGCSTCEGALTIGATIKRNVSYYIIAHASKFVPAGSVRISTDIPTKLPNVAFKTPAGKKVLIVLNENADYQAFNIKFNGQEVTVTIKNGSVATFIW
ncbi:MAG: glucosylceramidase [Bacteroidales bacterium]|nr:glucosylceramidase [Bacteroidales bacterium]